MGLARGPAARFGLFTLASIIVPQGLWAAPKLRLETAAVGPISIAAGQNGARQTVDAYNAGDGGLQLSVTGSAAWLAPTVGAARACTLRAGQCVPIQFELQTSALARGIYTATVTVTDPNAVDAPQEITVTAQVGGGVPDRVDLYVAPGGNSSVSFTTNSPLAGLVRTVDGAPWLSLALEGSGTFRFSYPYRVRVDHRQGMLEGAYSGSIAVSGSSLAADNKTIAVTARVTSQPIAKASPERLAFRIAQGTPKQTQYAALSNLGLGSLSLSGATVATASGGAWLTTAAPIGALLPVVADAGPLAPGTYTGVVTATTNAANPVSVAVDLTVLAPGPPRATFQGVVDNATFRSSPVGVGAIVAVFGEQFIAGAPAEGKQLPLVTELGGSQVLVNNVPAPLYYASYGQINFQIPYETAAGSAEVRVEREGQRGNAVSVEVVANAPRILRLGIGEYGIMVNQDGTFPIPPLPGVPSRRAKAGEALVVYGVGFGQTSPAVVSGAAAPSSPLASVPGTVRVTFGGGFSGPAVSVAPLFAGLTPGFVGLYQINVVIPNGDFSGDNVPMTIQSAGVSSNTVTLAIEGNATLGNITGN